MQTIHKEIAFDIYKNVKEQELPTFKTAARQGDILIERIGECEIPEPKMDIYGASVCVGVGRHGEHWLISDYVNILKKDDALGDIFLETSGGIIVHTDRPEARHKAIKCSPGRYVFKTEQEMGEGDFVVKVDD